MTTSNGLRAENAHPFDGGLRLVGTTSGMAGGVADLLRLLGDDNDGAQIVDHMPVAVRRLRDGESLFHAGSRVDAIHFVRAGTFKIFNTAEDGYEQVLGFSGRGEVLGFDAICMGYHPNEAIALEDSSVFVVLLRDYFELGQRIPLLDRLILRAASTALARRGDLADVMAAVAAEVRLARFLMHLSERMASSGQSPRRFHLRMGRRDIASYLGVAHETVSRSFGTLAGLGLVQVDNREVEILDIEGLKVFSCGTRRSLDDGERPHGHRPAPSSRMHAG